MKDQVAIVTGGSRGIGAATAKKLAQQGVHIAVVYAGNIEAANAVCEECRQTYGVKAEAFQCDVANYSRVKETVAEIKKAFGTVNILVNSAGITRDKLLAVMSE